MPTPPYNKLLLLGATSGIGQSLAHEFHKSGTSLIIAGRRKDRLDDFCASHPGCEAVTVDLSDTDSLPAFAARIIQTHPDLDAVFLNSGVQVASDWSKPESVDIGKIKGELDVNYWGYLVLVREVLGHLIGRGGKGEKAGLLFTTSGLGLIPKPQMPTYCATKAALHHFIISLRWQLRDKGVKITEIFPPAVQTELHDYMGEEKGRQVGIPLAQFTEEAWNGIVQGDEEIYVDAVKGWYEGFEKNRKPFFDKMAGATV